MNGRVLIRLLALFVAATGCDDTVIDPFDNDGRFFSVYGYLDVLQTDHVVRVVPVMRTPERILDPSDPQAQIDATVTSTDLSTGQTVRWRHSLERLADGTYGHLFRASFLVQPGRTYRLEVTRNDGARSTAETKVPFLSFLPDIGPFQLSEDSTEIHQDIVFEKVPSPWDITVLYYVGSEFAATPHYVAYARAGEPVADGGWRFSVNVSGDRNILSTRLGLPVASIAIVAMGLRMRLLDDRWTPPEGVFDPEVLAQPGTLSNVANGYGFWGSVGLFQHDWTLSCAQVDALGQSLPPRCL